MKAWIAAAAIGLAAAAPAASADPVAFAVNPGLWEVTTSGKSSGIPQIDLPPQALAQMSPEQRAKLAAGMQALAARQVSPHTLRSCLTTEKLRRGPTFGSRSDKSCVASVRKRTATEIEVRQVCNEAGRQTLVAAVHLEARTPRAIAGTADITVGEGAHAMKMHEQISAKWLGSDCGAVKP